MYNRILLPIVILIVIPFFSIAQDCTLSVSGYVTDAETGLPLELVNIHIEENEKKAVTDKKGKFRIDKLCKGDYHFIFSHIGCVPQRIYLSLKKNTSLPIKIRHTITMLGGVVVAGKSSPKSTQNTQDLNEQNITDNANLNLSNLLEGVLGVNTLKNGNGVSKPIIHGLYGNRLTILNNGIAQSGQKWGNDHSPEIDPLVADKIKVIKGVSTIEYPGSNLGSVILVETAKIGKEPHLHGKGVYYFESNGLSNGINVQLKQYNPILAWKINATLKKSGDKKTADYYLKNTGSQELNFALQLEKVFSKKLHTNLYFSSFNTTLGILRGGHIGNLTDLQSAFARDIPFFTEKNFSYDISPPKQKVNHLLLKTESKYFLSDETLLVFTLAGQLNTRKEFDVRRGERSEIPALSLKQYSYFAEAKYQAQYTNQININTGIQFSMIDNTNNPETGILPLIPDYLSFNTSVFAVATKKIERWLFEMGVRYDYIVQNTIIIKQTLPRTIAEQNRTYQNLSFSGGFNFQAKKNFALAYNIGYATRNPAVNELYSFGLHQGVSGIEEGNPNLSPEYSLKTTLSANLKIKESVSFESLFYYQDINDYIYLNPEDEIRLTIRGAFPIFKYRQTHGQIYGMDFSGLFQISKSFGLKLTYSFIKGNDLSKSIPLVNIPSNNFSASLKYIINKWKKFENIEFELTNKYVFKQDNLLPEQDFVLPPESYYLLGGQVATDLQLSKTRLRVYAKVDNMLNVAYRDYLNRQRYFADDLGINATLGISIKF